MRGKPTIKAFSADSIGITPAHAGKTLLGNFLGISPWDHPRACGENLKRLIFLPEVLGSPPRMRGKLDCYECTIN